MAQIHTLARNDHQNLYPAALRSSHRKLMFHYANERPAATAGSCHQCIHPSCRRSCCQQLSGETQEWTWWDQGPWSLILSQYQFPSDLGEAAPGEWLCLVALLGIKVHRHVAGWEGQLYNPEGALNEHHCQRAVAYLYPPASTTRGKEAIASVANQRDQFHTYVKHF